MHRGDHVSASGAGPHQLPDFIVFEQSRVKSLDSAGRLVEKIALAEQGLGADRIENGARIDTTLDAKRNAGRVVSIRAPFSMRSAPRPCSARAIFSTSRPAESKDFTRLCSKTMKSGSW